MLGFIRHELHINSQKVMAINQNAAFDPKHKYHTNASALLQAEASLMRLGLYETGTANELNF